MRASAIRQTATNRLLLSTLLVFACLMPGAVNGQSAGASAMPAPGFIAQHIGQPRLAGEGVFRWFGLRVYRARLWQGDQPIDVKTPTRNPLALSLTYARGFPGSAIAERSADEIAALALADEPTRARWRSLMEQIFPDVAASDTLTGVVDWQGMTHFYHNENAIGHVSERRFGEAFFAIWLHKRTSAPGLRNALLSVKPDSEDDEAN